VTSRSATRSLLASPGSTLAITAAQALGAIARNRGKAIMEHLLSASEAESVVDDRIEQFGLGALPRVNVAELPNGMWQVRWDCSQRTVPPMTGPDWQAWLEQNVGSLDAGDLETTES
jgi:hypothetical protein